MKPEHTPHDAGDIEQVVEHRGLSPRASLERRQRPLRASVVQAAALQELGPPQNRHSRRSQFVREGREELVLCPVGGFGRRPRLLFALQERAALVLERSTLGHVPECTNESGDVVLFVADIGPCFSWNRAGRPPSRLTSRVVRSPSDVS